MASVFSHIIEGTLPSYKIFEDEKTIAFLAMDQVTPGHTLVVPKVEMNHWFDVPSEDYVALQRNAQKIARAIQKATDAPRILTAFVGFEVPHAHLHLIPAWSMSDLNFSNAKKLPSAKMEELRNSIQKFL